MGRKAPRLCSHAGCGVLVYDGGQCTDHKQAAVDRKKAGQIDYNNRRAESDRMYSTERWRKLSIRYRQRHPLCCNCELNGLVRASELVDHIQPAKARPDLFYVWSNLRALCNKCHNEIGAKVRA